MTSDSADDVISCAACRFFRAPKRAEGGEADLAPDRFSHGTCRRYPVPALKRPDDWCGEFKRGAER